MSKKKYKRIDTGKWYKPYCGPFKSNIFDGYAINDMCWLIRNPRHFITSHTYFEIKDGYLAIYTPDIKHYGEWYHAGLKGFPSFNYVGLWVAIEDMPPSLIDEMVRLEVMIKGRPRHPLEDTFDECKALGRCKRGPKCVSRKVCYVYSELEAQEVINRANTEIVFKD